MKNISTLLPKTVCHVSFNHDAFDDRIYWKELIALKEAGYIAIHVCVGHHDRSFYTPEGIHIIEIKRKKNVGNIWVNRVLYFLKLKSSVIQEVLLKCKTLKADVYHYHDLQLNGIVKALKSLPQKPKVIYDAHECYPLLLKENSPSHKALKIGYSLIASLIAQWEIKSAKQCDFLIATDEPTLRRFERNIPGVKSELLYNYSYFISPDEKQVKPQKKYDFLYVGLISEARGIIDMLEAIAYLKEKFDPSALIIGSFETPTIEKQVNEKIESLGLTNNVQLSNAVPFDKIKFFYEESSIGIGIFHPTPKYINFIPIKLFEYMAFGLPVIFSDHGPSANIIKEVECGILVPPQNSYAISTAMVALTTNADLYNNLSKNGKRAVKEKYNWAIEKKKLLRIYSELFI